MRKIECLGKHPVIIRKMQDRRIFKDEHGFFIKIWGTFQAVDLKDGTYIPIPANEELWKARKDYKIK